MIDSIRRLLPKLQPPHFVLLLLTAFVPFSQTSAQTSSPASLPELKWHLTARPWSPLETPRTDPLDKVEAIVNQLASCQYWNTAQPGDVQSGGDVQNGSIIDPVSLKEWQYATPYFAFAVATVVSEGRSTSLVEAGARALDHATADIAGLDGSAQANDSHGEFFGAPMMKALRLFKQIRTQYPAILTSDRITKWENRLKTSRVSYMNNSVTQNWRTYAMKGEWLRVQDGLIPRTGGSGGQGVDWIEDRWKNEQRTRYTRDRDSLVQNPYFFMYHDDDTNTRQNFAYHGGATGNLLDMIRNGYDGASRDDIFNVISRAARSSLLQMAGSGDAPASGRTGNHVWNDVVYANTFEQMAEMTWAAGDKRLAGQFRRAARLALQSAWRFQQERGWFSVTKNLFPPAHRNVYFQWSALTNYNGYVEIHSSEIFATRLTNIPEQATPAEIGGFAINLDSQFGVSFANAGGMEVQMVTRGSSSSPSELAGGINCFTLGIVRFSRPGWESRLGPSDGWMASDWTSAISFSPTFLESGAWQMVSQLSNRYGGTFTPTFVHPLLVRGALVFAPKSGQTGPTFTMDLTVTPDGVLVDTKRTSGTETFGVTWPLLEFDGRTVLSTSIDAHIAATAYPRQSPTRVISQAETAALSGGVATDTSLPNFTGAASVTFPATGGKIQWSGVDGGDGGSATIGFRYTLRQASAATRNLTLRVNGQERTVTFEHTGNPATYGSGVLSFPMDWHQLHVPATLAAGTANTIELDAGAAAASGLSIDELRVFPAVASQPEPDQETFISLDASPTIDSSTALRRTAYGDQRPLRVTNGNATVSTFVYPRKAGDPAAETVRTSFARSGSDFSSVLGRVKDTLYVGRTSAGGEGTGIDLDNDGTNDVTFDATCQFVLQLDSGAVKAIEADRPVTVTLNGRSTKLAAFTPIAWDPTAAAWNNQSAAASGSQFEWKTTFTPSGAETCVGFSAAGANSVDDLVAAVRFGTDGKIVPVSGAPLTSLTWQSGVAYRIRVLVDLNERTYSVWVKPTGAPEKRLVAGATLPAWVTSPASLRAFTFQGEAQAATSVTATSYGPLSVKINFQDVTSTGYAGYLPDTGEAYGDRGNGFSYGWIEGPNVALARNRNSSNAPDERYDSLNQMQYNNPATETHTWEIALPNGAYDVKLVCGDPGFTDSNYVVLAEGSALLQGNAAGTGQIFFESTARVTVSDGRLTLTNGAGAYRNKICFLEITSAASTAYPYQSYSSWASGLFSGGLTNPLAAAQLDPNGNGIANALEYLAGRNPLSTAWSAAPFTFQMPGSSSTEFRFYRSAKALSASYAVEESSDLLSWSPVWESDADTDFSSPLVSISDPAADGWVTLQIPTSPAVAKKFYRLNVQIR